MKRTLALLMFCCGILLGVNAGAGDNPKLKAEITEARKSGIPKYALNIFLSQAEGSRMPLDVTKKILKEAVETQKVGAPGDKLLMKASEGVAKSIPPAKIIKAVNTLGKEFQAIAESVPKTLAPQARKKAIIEKFMAAHPVRPAPER